MNRVELELRNIDAEKYKVLRGETDIRNMGNTVREDDVTYLVRQREYSELTLTAEIARYLNLSPLLVCNLLANSLEGTEKVLEAVNTYNRLLHDWVIPRLVSSLYEVKEYKDDTNEIEVDLVKEPESGFYRVKAKPELLVRHLDEAMLPFHDKSFHLDNYCFDSKPEHALFNRLIQNESVEKVWFTGMLTQGQTDFVVSYVDPDSHVVRSYYPDFLVKMKSGKYYILEVKRDDQIDTRLVQAKADYARQLASSSGMEYMMIPGKEAGTVTIA